MTTSGVATFNVTLEMVDKAGLLAGMTVDAKISIASKDNVLIIPVNALSQRGKRSFVLVSTDGSTDPAAAKRTAVEIGLSTTDNVEVTKGLAAGEKILIPVASSSSKSANSMMPFGGGGFREDRPRNSSSGGN